MAKFNIPGYSNLPPKKKQMVNMIAGGLAAVTVVMFVSGFVGGPAKVNGIGKGQDMPKPKPLGAVPGTQLDSKDVWVGGAAKDVTRIREDYKTLDTRIGKDTERQERINKEILERLDKLTRTGGSQADVRAEADAKGEPSEPDGLRSRLLPSQGRSGAPGSEPMNLNGQPRTGRLPTPNSSTYPPATPNMAGRPQGGQMADAAGAMPPTAVGLVRVSALQGGGSTAPAAPGGAAGPAASAKDGGTPLRNLDTYLPVGYAKAVLLGGLLAPTGGQAQNNPIPILLRITDLAFLPNGFRGMVKDCFVVAEGYGDQSAERAYGRTTLMSCILKDKTVIEVPLKGSIFGEDGMNGIRGRLITKQGQILTNALLSGIASGIGSGLAQSTQITSTTGIGTTTTNPTDTAGILKQGAGTGVSKALDRLSQYYINLAEKLFPVVEIQPGREVDVVITQGVQLDLTMFNGKVTGNPNASRGPQGPQRTLLRSVSTDAAEEE